MRDFVGPSNSRPSRLRIMNYNRLHCILPDVEAWIIAHTSPQGSTKTYRRIQCPNHYWHRCKGGISTSRKILDTSLSGEVWFP